VSRIGQVRIGTSGWNYRHWRRRFYPPDLAVRDWFSFYSRSFDTVEINNTFYRLPGAEIFASWRQQAPSGFVYAVKASRFLTHLKKLKDPVEPLQRILGRARILGGHLGPVLYQLPPNWRCDLDRIRRFIAELPRDLQHVLEFRDPSWHIEEVQSLLRESGIAFCIHDLRGCASPCWITAQHVYLRFHGPARAAYGGRYDHTHLATWAEKIVQLQASGRDVYAYFNNDENAYAVANACELRDLIKRGRDRISTAPPHPPDDPPA
jgi:uncharacterized protein YecE (DUF72 family)